MALYTGNLCPVCNESFTDTDDVVVCPDCGTPYHRACWQKVGACVHADKHGAGFEWVPDKAPETPADAAPEEHICPNCGAHNAAGARFCDHCGTPFSADPFQERSASSNSGPVYTRPGNPAPGSGTAGGSAANGAAGAAQQPGGFTGVYRRELRPDDTIDGIKAKDWASYLGPSSLAYLAQFVHMDELKRKTSVSFSAFFLGPLYFFYRKMWKEGVIFTLVSLVMMLPTVLALFQAAGSPLVAGVNLDWLVPVSWAFVFLDWAQMVVRSLFAFYWYKKDASRRIHDICARLPEGQERSDALAMRGGTSAAAVAIYLLAMLGVSLLICWLMGSGRSLALDALMRAYAM